MPAYNREKYIKDAIDSILNQTYDNFEFIIINDGSNDNTYDIVKNYSDSRINLINNKINMGISWSSNKGLAIARGKYIARMDSDDICMSQRFRKQIDFMEKNQKLGFVEHGELI